MKNILITGASRGIGESIAYHFADKVSMLLVLQGRNSNLKKIILKELLSLLDLM